MEACNESENLQDSKQNFQNKNSVLVVDDSLEFLILQKMVLELDGYEVFTAQSGAEALERLSEIDPPGLILLDMYMDDMTGTDFLDTLEETHPEIVRQVPVVFMSGADVPDSKAVAYLRKPAEVNSLLKVVHRFTNREDTAPYKH